jgi:hypothetical protein
VTWPPWEREREPAALARYARPGVVCRLLSRAPGPGTGSVETRLRQLYEQFAERGIRYDYAALDSAPGRQVIRPPDQVLARPGLGTCLDIAVAFAGGCLDAGLRPTLVVLDPPTRGDASHAVAVVRLVPDAEDPPSTEQIRAALVSGTDDIGEYLAVDVALLAAGYPAGAGRDWDAAVASGARLLLGGDWRWSAAVTAGGQEPYDVPGWPRRPVLQPPYVDRPGPARDEGPLRQVWARYGVVPFQPRDEFTILRDWSSAERTGLRVAGLHGPGGAGKTRLAAELASRLAGDAWYAGFLDGPVSRDEGEWLAGVVSPLLVVVDYAEDGKAGEINALLDTLLERSAPTRVLLTARTLGPWWDDDIVGERIGRAEQRSAFELRPRPGRPAGLFRSACAAFRGAPAATPDREPARLGGAWGTLDLIMLAWLAVHDAHKTPPDTPEDLYARILHHELRYWRRSFRERYAQDIDPGDLRACAACLSLLSPRRERVPDTLSGVAALEALPRRRRDLAELITGLVPAAGPDGPVAVQPDLLAEHLILRVLGTDTALLARCVDQAEDDEQVRACAAVSRAWHQDSVSAERITRAMLAARPELWRAALGTPLARSGPFVQALEEMAEGLAAPLPWAELSEQLPVAHANLRRLAHIAARRALAPPAESREGLARRAETLNTLAVRLSEVGRPTEALEASTEAVAHYRALVAVSAEEFLPLLGRTLANHALNLGTLGRRIEAVDASAEAVALLRAVPDAGFMLARALSNHAGGLADAHRDAEALDAATEAIALFDPGSADGRAGLATALSGRSNRLAALGRRAEAVAACREAVGHWRVLVEQDAGAYSPQLALALNNLANHLGRLERHTDAAQTCRESVEIYRALAEADPEAFLPDLAMSVGNLAGHLDQADRGQEALAVYEEAVGHYRRLLWSAADRPEEQRVIRRDLARNLSNLASRLVAVGRPAAGAEAAGEAVAHCRALAENDPDLLTELAAALNNLSLCQVEVEQAEQALTVSAEAIGHYRALAESDRLAHLPALAMTLLNRASQLGAAGRLDEAVSFAKEAAASFRALAGEDGQAYLPALAQALNDLSVHLAALGNRNEARKAAAEAVVHYRALAVADQAAYRPGVAMALNNLSNDLAGLGRVSEALEATREAVSHYRALAAAEPPYRGHLAGSLTNLSAHLATIGEPSQALDAITESVTLSRALADEDPARFLPHLASSLTDLSARLRVLGRAEEALEAARRAVAMHREAGSPPLDLARSLNGLTVLLAELGRPAEALEPITEAIGLLRAVAETRPSGLLPDLGVALTNRANQLAKTGHRDEALAVSAEAVAHYRALDEAAPGAFLAELATALNNHGNRLSENGLGDEAVAVARAAVTIRRALAAAAPEAYLPDLAASLGGLGRRYADLRGPEVIEDEYQATYEVLGPGPRAELMSAVLEHDLPEQDWPPLSQAIRWADEEPDPARRSRARRHVRSVVRAYGHPLAAVPAWATAEFADGMPALLDQWVQTQSWPERIDFLRDHAARLDSASGRESLRLARDLSAGHAQLDQLEQLLGLIAGQGLPAVLDQLSATNRQAQLVQDWLAAPTWAASLDYLNQHLRAFAKDTTVGLLRALAGDEETTRQHAGILLLAVQHRVPSAEIRDAVEDPLAAADLAMRLIEEGDPAALSPLALAAPRLAAVPFTAPFVAAVRHVIDHEDPGDDARALMAAAASQGDLVQRTAGAVRLRLLSRRLPGSAAEFNHLADLLIRR